MESIELLELRYDQTAVVLKSGDQHREALDVQPRSGPKRIREFNCCCRDRGPLRTSKARRPTPSTVGKRDSEVLER